jgi:hypothetical protein
MKSTKLGVVFEACTALKPTPNIAQSQGKSTTNQAVSRTGHSNTTPSWNISKLNLTM